MKFMNVSFTAVCGAYGFWGTNRNQPVRLLNTPGKHAWRSRCGAPTTATSLTCVMRRQCILHDTERKNKDRAPFKP
ncbi:MAG: hypothetical protein Q8N17_06445, partial [Burkholderiaceae bacterium]|nr:hypothetical protein [Burkholderiaceae bacterium]